MSTVGGPRIHVDERLGVDAEFDLPASQARHVQVLRLQPGDGVTLFDGQGGEWRARITRMGRAVVSVQVVEHLAIERELRRHVTVAFGMPANERMDQLVEKATELGAAAIQPLVCERSVLRLAGERAARRRAHWQGVAMAACEQSGRTRLPEIGEVLTLRSWLDALGASPAPARRVLLGPDAGAAWGALAAGPHGTALVFLSGPEGGLTAAETGAALAAGFVPATLGLRILRADTAPLAALAWCSFESHPDPTPSS